MNYIEISTKCPSHQGRAIAYNKIGEWIKRCIKNEEELYRSVFFFDKAITEHMQSRLSPKGYIYNYYLPYLVFDIDRGINSDDYVLRKAKEFYTELSAWTNDIRAFFSGSGYHFVTRDFFAFEPSNTLQPP